MKQTPDKSDGTDAKLLAAPIRAGYLPRVWLAPKNIRDLRDLIRHRHGLVEQRKQTKLRLCALLQNHRIALIRYDPHWRDMAKQLRENGKNTETARK